MTSPSLGLGALVTVSAAGTEVPGAAKALGYELEKALGGARDQLLIDQEGYDQGGGPEDEQDIKILLPTTLPRARST